MKIQKAIVRFISFSLLLYTLCIGYVLLRNEQALGKFLFRGDYSVQNVNKILTTWNYYESKEKVAIGIFNAQLAKDSLNFEQIEFLADSLLKTNSRSSQGYYLKTVVSERKQDLEQAMSYISQALKFDPLNTTYLLGVAVIQINNNQFLEAGNTLDRVRNIDPDTKNLDSVSQILENLKNSK